MYDVTNATYKAGDQVRLGNGTRGRVEAKVVGPTGFISYRVKLTTGDSVYATPAGMARTARTGASTRTAVVLGGRRFACAVARTPAELERGLQGHPGLAPGQGLAFVFDPARSATFHMGKVAFPIDIVFGYGGRVRRIVHDAQPGDTNKWACPKTDLVVEVPGGTCADLGITPGAALRRTAAAPPLPQDRYTVEIPHEVTNPDGRNPEDRYPAGTPDETSPNADEMSNDLWHQQLGFDPSRQLERGEPALRPSAAAATPVDMLEGALRDPNALNWTPDDLNHALEYAIVTTDDAQAWLGGDYEVTTKGMQDLGDALILGGVADTTDLTGDGTLVLWRYS